MERRKRLQEELSFLEWAIAHNQKTMAALNKQLAEQTALAVKLRRELERIDDENNPH